MIREWHLLETDAVRYGLANWSKVVDLGFVGWVFVIRDKRTLKTMLWSVDVVENSPKMELFSKT